MLKQTRFILSAALLFCHQLSCAETVMNKCTDGKTITYTDKPCEKLGLTGAGPIQDTVTIMPASPLRYIKKEAPEAEPAVPSAAKEGEAYQCTNFYGVVSFSSKPCTEASFVPQLKAYVPAQQQAVSQSQACEKISADANLKSRSNLSCP